MLHEVFIKGKDGITYVNTAILNTRQQINRVILPIIDEYNNKFDDLRFQQILVNLGIASIEDLFHEESKRTLNLMLSNSEVQKYFRKYEVKKADIINIDKFKNNKDNSQ